MFRPKVTVIEKNKDIDFMRVDELVDSLQTCEITLLDSHKPKESTFRATKIDQKKFKIPNRINRDELAHMAKCIKQALKLNKRSNENQDSRKEKRFGYF